MADYAERFVHRSDVELIFKKTESESGGIEEDPTWQCFEGLYPSDSRNLRQKIKDACAVYPEAKLVRHERVAARSKVEQQSIPKKVLALKWRTYEACADRLIEKADELPKTEEEIDALLGELKVQSSLAVSKLAADYSYPVSNENALEGMVLDLFDTCFLALDDKNPGDEHE